MNTIQVQNEPDKNDDAHPQAQNEPDLTKEASPGHSRSRPCRARLGGFRCDISRLRMAC